MSNGTIVKQVTYVASRETATGETINSVPFETRQAAELWLESPLEYQFVWNLDDIASYDDIMDMDFESEEDRKDFADKIESGYYMTYVLSLQVCVDVSSDGCDKIWKVLDSIGCVVIDSSDEAMSDFENDILPESLRGVKIERVVL